MRGFLEALVGANAGGPPEPVKQADRRRTVPRTKDDLKERLSRYRQIQISVIGRKSGRTISIPVWFVLEGEELYLLPVQGSDTQWYKNVLENRQLRISVRAKEGEFQAAPVTDAKAVNSAVEKFIEKYGARDVKKYYSRFDVAVRVDLA
jgi:deazaflavin-dependent oxidoreductase (nitroreductase family)